MKKYSAHLSPALLAALMFCGICRITGQVAHAVILTALLFMIAFVMDL